MIKKLNEICPVLGYLIKAQDKNEVKVFDDLEEYIDSLYPVLSKETETEFVDQFDVMTTYHLSRTTLYMWRQQGLASYTIGGKVFFKMDEVQSFIETHKKGGSHVSDC